MDRTLKELVDSIINDLFPYMMIFSNAAGSGRTYYQIGCYNNERPEIPGLEPGVYNVSAIEVYIHSYGYPYPSHENIYQFAPLYDMVLVFHDNKVYVSKEHHQRPFMVIDLVDPDSLRMLKAVVLTYFKPFVNLADLL